MKSFQDISSVKIQEINNISASSGSLAFLESHNDVPFAIERVFYIYNIKSNQTRGNHAHIDCDQFLICLNGTIEVTCDDGEQKNYFILDKPTSGLYIPSTIWSRQKYIVDNSILMVLTDRKYEENDYIRDYEEFLDFRKKQ